MLYSLRVFDRSEVAQQRMKIMRFYEKYGEKAEKEAFGADRKVISRWRKRLKDNGGSLSALIPYSTRPQKVKTSNVPHKSLRLKSPIEYLMENGGMSQMSLTLHMLDYGTPPNFCYAKTSFMLETLYEIFSHANNEGELQWK